MSDSRTDSGHDALDWTPEGDGPARPADARLVYAGLALAVAGTLAPWAGFAGFPGKMTLAFYPGGARAYCLVLVALAAVAFATDRARRRAGEAAAIGLLAVAGWTALAIAHDGGGIVNLSVGAYLTLAGGVLLLLGFERATRDADPPALPSGPHWLGPFVIVAVMAGALWLTVKALDVEASSQFVALLLAGAFAVYVLVRLGAVGWFAEVNARYRAVLIGAGLVAAALFPFTQGGRDYWVRVACSVGVFAATAVGLNIVVGLAGLLDLGYVAFFGVGAYVGASLSGSPTSNVRAHVPFLLVIGIGAVFAAVVGVIIGAPTLRLRGDYLAIVTLGFGEIFRITMNNLDGADGPKLTNGPNGIPRIPHLKAGALDFGDEHSILGIKLGFFANYFYAELLLLVVVALVFVRLNQSRIGRAWVAIREDETAAAAMGVNTVRLKLLAFAIGAFLAGAAGTLNAHLTTQVDPTSYTFNESILLLAAVVLGGMGTIGGALLGSTLLVVLPEKLRFFENYRILLFGLALVLMMRFRPEGIVPNRRRQREFHEAGGGADATSAPPGGPVATVTNR